MAARPRIAPLACTPSRPAPALGSPFRREREYAGRSRVPWFVLSAEHGLLAPSSALAPYNRRLTTESAAYRHDWGQRVLTHLREQVGSLSGLIIEIHAGSAYTDPIRDVLQAEGARLREPLARRSRPRRGRRVARRRRVRRPHPP